MKVIFVALIVSLLTPSLVPVLAQKLPADPRIHGETTIKKANGYLRLEVEKVVVIADESRAASLLGKAYKRPVELPPASAAIAFRVHFEQLNLVYNFYPAFLKPADLVLSDEESGQQLQPFAPVQNKFSSPFWVGFVMPSTWREVSLRIRAQPDPTLVEQGFARRGSPDIIKFSFHVLSQAQQRANDTPPGRDSMVVKQASQGRPARDAPRS